MAVAGRGLTPTRWEWVVLFVVSAILTYQLLLPPIVGLADNGDFARIMNPRGISAPPGDEHDRYFNWIIPRYRIDPESRWWRGSFLSSETVFVLLSRPVARLISPPGEYDLRAIGLAHGVGFLTVLSLALVAARPLGAVLRILLVALLLLVFTDVGYLAYFNSFYSEPASLIFLFASLALALLSFERKGHSNWLFLGFLLASALFLCAKPQNSPLAPLFGFLAIRLSHEKQRTRWRGLGAVTAAGFCLLSFAYLAQTPVPMRQAYLYDVVFYEMLRNSPDPRADLAALGLPEEFDRFVGTSAFHRGAPIWDPAFQKKFFGQVRATTVAGFYLERPDRLWNAFERAARHAFRMRPENLGNFEKATGLPPASQSQAFSLWSGIKERFAPGSLWFLIVFLGVNLGVAFATRRGARADLLCFACEIWVVLILIAAFQFALCAGGEGDFSLIKHLFLFQAAVDLLFLALCLRTANVIPALIARRRPSVVEQARARPTDKS